MASREQEELVTEERSAERLHRGGLDFEHRNRQYTSSSSREGEEKNPPEEAQRLVVEIQTTKRRMSGSRLTENTNAGEKVT